MVIWIYQMTTAHNLIMNLFANMFNSIKHTRLWLKTPIANYNENFQRLPTAIRGIPKIADDRIPEITPRFPKTSEDFPMITKVLGIPKGIQKSKAANCTRNHVVPDIVISRCKLKCPCDQKNHFPFFLRFWKCVCLTLHWQNSDLSFLSKGCLLWV